MANIYDLDEMEAQERPFDRRYFVRMLRYLKPYAAQVGVVVVLMLIVSLGSLAEPILIKNILDSALTTKDLAALNKLILALLGLRIVVWLGSRWQTRLLNWTGQHVLYDLRQQLFAHIQQLSFDFYDSRPVGKIMSRITNDVNEISQFVNSEITSLVTQLFTLAGIIAIMVGMHLRLSLLCFSLLPLLILFLAKIEQRLERGWLNVRRAVASINAHLNETVTGMQVIQAFTRQSRNAQRFTEILDKKLEAYMGVVFLEILFWPVVELIAAVGTCLVLWYGASLYLDGVLTIGALWAFISYLKKFWQPISAFSQIYSQMLSAMASAERVFGFLDTEPKIVDAPNAVEMPQIEGTVEFKNVSFGYQEGQTVLQDVSFKVKPGQTVALVGPTGAGKSTIINLLARFYDPTAGSVMVDGFDLRDVTLRSYRSQLGMVLQDTFIFSGTIRENIEYGRLGAELREIINAAQAVNAHSFIMQYEKGYDTATEERGGTLSTGQRQLVAFARALLADPRILILDEATSSIDTETEQLIQKALDKLLQGRTSFVIAHRLSTIRKADIIFVIDDGRIVEKGSHEELLARKGKYYQLYSTQYSHLKDMLPVAGE